jgi:superfamily I DNA/RNA helicase
MDDNAVPEWLVGIKGSGPKLLIESDAAVIKAVAGPGAGKTTALERRVRRLVKTGKAKPSEIFVGTFTRVIAKALGIAFAKAVKAYGTDDSVNVSTLHAEALRLLQRAEPNKHLRFLLEHEEKAMLYDIGEQVPPDIGQVKRGQNLRDLQAAWAANRSLDDERFSGAVEAWLHAHRGMLVGEVVFRATEALSSGSITPGLYKHVIVDEFQDLTECEQVFVDFLAGPAGSRVVLGDNDQSIYAFRDNHPGGIIDFPRTGTALSIPLPDNFRCPRQVVGLANRIAALMRSPKPAMEMARSEEGDIVRVQWPTLSEEISGVAQVIKASNENFLVLVPRRFIGHRLQAEIGDDAVTVFRERVLHTPLVRERFTLASVLADELDLVAVRGWLALRGSAPTEANKRNAPAYASLQTCGKTGRDLFDAIVSRSIKPSGMGAANIQSRAEHIVAAIAALPESVEDQIGWLFDPALADIAPLGIPNPDPKASAADREDEERTARIEARNDLAELRAAAFYHASKLKTATLRTVLGALRYRIATCAPLTDDEPDRRVRIMTLHGAKGLEEDNVVVVALADQFTPGIGYPNDSSRDRLDRAEKQRLIYVAVTRSMRKLVLSWANAMPTYEARRNRVRPGRRLGFPRGREMMSLSLSKLLPHEATAPMSGPRWIREESKTIAQSRP